MPEHDKITRYCDYFVSLAILFQPRSLKSVLYSPLVLTREQQIHGTRKYTLSVNSLNAAM